MSDKHLVFLVHGIGSHQAGWSKNYQKKIVQLAKKYQALKGANFLNQVEFEEITYDSVFADQVQNWEDNFDSLIAGSPQGSRQSVREALEWMDGMAGQKDNFLWTHVADAVLWKISPYLRNHIITRVGRMIAEGINRKINESSFIPEYSIIAHSLGTSVVHQALAALADGAWSGDNFNAFNANDTLFSSIHMISNVGHYFETDADKIYGGIVRPGVLNGVHGYCNRYYSYTNKFDPISWPGRFSPPWSANDGYHEILVSHLHGRNVHDVSHYLENPKVHIPLIRALTKTRRIKSEEEINALNAFKQISGELEGEANEFKARVEELKGSINQFRDLGSWIKGWTNYGLLSQGG